MPATSQASSLHHHHALSTPSSNSLIQSPHSIAPHPGPARPELGRAHTFPTPPASASSLIGVAGSGGNSYEWNQPANSTMPNNQPLSIDTGLSNARSVPNTPASTPPAHNMGNMQQYQTTQGYDASRQLYTAPPPASGQYGSQPGVNRFNPLQPSPFPKSEMAPPAARAEGDAGVDTKPYGPGGEPVGPGQVLGEEADDTHDNEYTHTSAPAQGQYSYNPAPGLHDDHNNSPHQNGSGQATPRSTNTQTYLPGYGTPQRTQTAPASSNLYNVISHPQAAAPNGAPAAEPYPSSYQTQPYASTNGATAGTKRGRDDEDDGQDPYGRGDDLETGPDGLKRRKTHRDDSAGLNRTKSTPVSRRR
jgi:enhanced filamentous growth protein 1